jgi:hypothetical protein
MDALGEQVRLHRTIATPMSAPIARRTRTADAGALGWPDDGTKQEHRRDGAHRRPRTRRRRGPFDGELVTRGNGMAVRVDAAQLRGWAGWAFAGAEHVAPLDLALSTDGQDVLLPWCVRTVRAHLAQATDTGGSRTAKR